MNNHQNTGITVWLNISLESRLKEIAKLNQKSQQQIIIEAVEKY